MSDLIKLISSKWKTYKFRFVPWIILNLNTEKNRSQRLVSGRNQVKELSAEEVKRVFESLFEKLPQYVSLKENFSLYKELHKENLNILLKHSGFNLETGPSTISGAGNGVFVKSGKVKAGSLVALYPGTVYLPHQPIFLQSICNPYIFRCADGTLIDGNHKYLSKTIFKSCTGRDQIGMVRVADTSWLTLRSVNPLNIGQIVNNETRDLMANVQYQEADIPLSFPLELRKFLPIINYEGGYSEGVIRIVYLQATRDIVQGEELFSSYFTVFNPAS